MSTPSSSSSTTTTTSPLRKIVFIQRIAQFAGSSPRRALKLAYVNNSEWRSAILDFSFQQLFFDPFVKPLIALSSQDSSENVIPDLMQKNKDCAAVRGFSKFRKFLSFVFRCVSEENNEIIVLVKQSLDAMLEELQKLVAAGEGKSHDAIHPALHQFLDVSSFSWQVASWVAENTRNPNLFHFLFPVPTISTSQEALNNKNNNDNSEDDDASPTSPTIHETFWRLSYKTSHQGILFDVNNPNIDPVQTILGFYSGLRGLAVELIRQKCSSLASIAAKAGNVEVVKIICDPSRDTRFIRILENLYLRNTSEVKTLWIAPILWSIRWQAIAAAQGGDCGRFDWKTSAAKEWMPLNVVRWLSAEGDEEHGERLRREHNHNVYLIVKFLLEELLVKRFDCRMFVGFNGNWSDFVRADANQMDWAARHPEHYSQERKHDLDFNHSLVCRVTDLSTATASETAPSNAASLDLREINYLLSNTRKFKRSERDTYGHHFWRRSWTSGTTRSCCKTIFYRACYRRQDELIRYFEQEMKVYKESDRPPPPFKK